MSSRPGAGSGGSPRPAITLGLSGVSLGFGLASSGTPGNVALQVNLDQVKAGLELRTPEELSLALGANALTLTTAPATANTAVGVRALSSNSTGGSNTAVGNNAALGNQTGSSNVALGTDALRSNRFGRTNIAIGDHAGEFVSGDNNIAIGSIGDSFDSNIIRIGNSTHTRTHVGGIFGRTSFDGVGVFISANGQLGTLTSSARFKDDMQPIGDVHEQLQALRPVRFVYKPEHDDGSRQVQFGLIAEEVAETFPELAVLDEDGRPSTVRYHVLTPLLLAEVQRLQHEIEHLKKTVAALQSSAR